MSFAWQICRTRSRTRTPNLASKDRLAVLRDEHEMQVDLMDRMSALAVPRHAQPYRKPPKWLRLKAVTPPAHHHHRPRDETLSAR